MATFFDRIRELLAGDEAEAAVEQLLAALKGTSRPEDLREVIVQAGRLSRLRKQARKGFLSEDQLARERARIADSLLQFVDELAARTVAADRPFATAGVSFEPPASAALEKIFGASHLKGIAWLARGIEVAASVCRVVTPQGVGTGFLVAPDRLLTNHHVIAEPGFAAKSFAEMNFQEDASGALQTFYRYRLSAEGFQTHAELDWSLVRIERDAALPPLESWGVLPLETGPPPEVGEHVTIIQHPGGGAKQIALTANQVVNLFEHRLQYTTDTLPGSSGSPVFNDAWKVVALHHAGGNLVKNQRGDRMYANEGILVAKLVERWNGKA
ncbi:MAG TPA: trypsin-like peptidase domain-containing protein [Thermoanaerobaculia bacterium]|nr:trypsin-like peptidase domain-containing protein [Thermoanaerobaculia bacterium]